MFQLHFFDHIFRSFSFTTSLYFSSHPPSLSIITITLPLTSPSLFLYFLLFLYPLSLPSNSLSSLSFLLFPPLSLLLLFYSLPPSLSLSLSSSPLLFYFPLFPTSLSFSLFFPTSLSLSSPLQPLSLSISNAKQDR